MRKAAVAKKTVAPTKLIEQTQKSMAYYKANPRPPSALPSKMTPAK